MALIASASLLLIVLFPSCWKFGEGAHLNYYYDNGADADVLVLEGDLQVEYPSSIGMGRTAMFEKRALSTKFCVYVCKGVNELASGHQGTTRGCWCNKSVWRTSMTTGNSDAEPQLSRRGIAQN